MVRKIIASFVAITLAASLLGQSAALPLLSNGSTDLSFTTQVGFNQKWNNDDRVRLYEFFARFGIGFKNTFDLYALVGAVKQNTQFGDVTISNFDSDVTAGGGGGIAIKWPFALPFGTKITTTGQATMFSPSGQSYSLSTVPNTNYRRRNDLNYDWVRFQAATFISRQFQNYEFYIGGLLQSEKVDVKKELTLESDEGEFFLSSSKGLYKETRQPNVSAGINISLPGNHQLGLEVRAGAEKDLAIFIGIGQTGSP